MSLGYNLAIADLGMCLAQGLPPLPEPSDNPNADAVSTTTKPKATNSKSLNFSSTGPSTAGAAAKRKRKAVLDLQLQDEDFASLGDMVKDKKSSKPVKKKPKKTDKKLLSFGDDA
jgi:hypothetical protein